MLRNKRTLIGMERHETRRLLERLLLESFSLPTCRFFDADFSHLVLYLLFMLALQFVGEKRLAFRRLALHSGAAARSFLFADSLRLSIVHFAEERFHVVAVVRLLGSFESSQCGGEWKMGSGFDG